jgi:acetyl esterase/lipase
LVPVTDGRRALKLLREKSDHYGFDPDHVCVLGFSAGSHLATVLSVHESNDESENPDYSALIYGVTDLSPKNLKWIEESLYHRELTQEEIEGQTLLNLVTERSPPAFLVHAYDDEVCYVKESILYAKQLQKFNVKHEMHLFQKGGHGFGIGRAEDGTDQWIDLFVKWLTVVN